MVWQKEKRLQLLLFCVRGHSARSEENAPEGKKEGHFVQSLLGFSLGKGLERRLRKPDRVT